MRGSTDSDSNAFSPSAERGDGTLRAMRFLIALPFNILEAVGRAGFYGAWHLLYFVACAFRAFTGFLVLAGIVMLPMALGVYADPTAAPMPWWFFLVSALGMFALAVGYNLFLGWFTPPGAEDPFDRYRPGTRKP